MLVSFRCKNCGFLHTSDDAAEAAHPHTCRVCGSGVSFHPKTGVKSLDQDNWEILSKVPPKRLAELGLKDTHVGEHKPWPAGSSNLTPQHLHLTGDDTTSPSDNA